MCGTIYYDLMTFLAISYVRLSYLSLIMRNPAYGMYEQHRHTPVIASAQSDQGRSLPRSYELA